MENTNIGDILKKTGVSRRIDDLGRIVIPKEIRKNLKIRDNDELEITVNDNTILLNKFSQLEKNEVIDILIKAFYKVFKKNILITTKDMIINYVINDKIDSLNLELSNSLIKKIEDRKMFISPEFISINLFNTIHKLSILVNPLIINGDLLGSVIIYSDNESIENRDIDVSNVIKIFLENYLE